MQNVILVIHILASIVLTALVLLQKSEGGGLGLGGGGGGGNSIMSGRGTAGALVRTTIMIGALFFGTSLTLTSIASRSGDRMTDVERSLGGDEVPATGQPGDLFDPSTPLLEGQQGVVVPDEAVTPLPETDNTLVDPSAETLPQEAPETDTPQ